MSKKSARVTPPALNPKAAICKEPGCFSEPSIKGYCRLHFLKVLAGKSQGDATPRGKLASVRGERRRADRARGLDPLQPNELELSDRVQDLGELALDDIDLSEVSEIEDIKKTG